VYQKRFDPLSLIDNVRDNGYRITTIGNMTDLFKFQAPWAASAHQWSQDKISNAEFLKTVKSMIQQDMVHDTTSSYNFTTIPSWVKHDIKFQSQGLISDNEFLNIMEYLVKVQAIR
jgi:hypothetical protein